MKVYVLISVLGCGVFDNRHDAINHAQSETIPNIEWSEYESGSWDGSVDNISLWDITEVEMNTLSDTLKKSIQFTICEPR